MMLADRSNILFRLPTVHFTPSLLQENILSRKLSRRDWICCWPIVFLFSTLPSFHLYHFLKACSLFSFNALVEYCSVQEDCDFAVI